MRASKILGFVAALVAAPVVLSATAGVAAADATATVTAGKKWIVVSVTTTGGDLPEWCRVDPYFGTPQTVSLEVAPSGNLFVDNVPPGPRKVSVWCPNGGATVHDVVVQA
ncbi:hypothetical protein [Nocardia flavorosea]|uniref:Ig-like domain-containing protein n=1 Tax=Nocardia flavorosea TaxID=53429 RepID=A0A846YVH7_9NOCA|nr:hypothetical protein [Nocardia flavorosea]NKY61009.1 hypothetical protein [Nocardia flavorosea]